MRYTQTRLRLCTALIAAILVFIWGNSLMPGNVSLAISDWAKELLKRFLPEDAPMTREGSGLLRKIAHFMEFAALGFCIAWRRGMLRKSLIPGFWSGAAAAAMDETIQLFVPNRGPGIKDVLLDSCGVLAGMLALYFGHTLLKKRKSQ